MLTKKYPSTTRIVGIVLRSYIPNSGEVAIVTDGFHQLRASLIAKKQGLIPYSVSAHTPWFVYSAYYVRELYALVQEIILKGIAV